MPTTDAALPVLFLDFDNTITRGDLLDRAIERYSMSDDWQAAEREWRDGLIGSRACLTRQIDGMHVSADELARCAAVAALDPAFAGLVAWSWARNVDLVILSDSFACIIRAVLRAQRLDGVPVRANELVFAGDRPSARFPWIDPGCARCAHCKAQHLRAATKRPRIFVGDGLSDTCAAQVADVVFAKDSLAAELDRRGIAYHPFGSLAEVASFVRMLVGR